jgi:Trk K+ transport system NAD-binding subunit
VELPPQLAGRNVMQLNVPGEIMVVAVTRNDHAFVPAAGTEFHEDDLVHLVVLSSAMDRLEELLGMEGR